MDGLERQHQVLLIEKLQSFLRYPTNAKTQMMSISWTKITPSVGYPLSLQALLLPHRTKSLNLSDFLIRLTHQSPWSRGHTSGLVDLCVVVSQI